jgi:hypothetical protein
VESSLGSVLAPAGLESERVIWSAIIAESSAAQMPSEEDARRVFSEALEAVNPPAEPEDEAAALRTLARAATGLARVLSR